MLRGGLGENRRIWCSEREESGLGGEQKKGYVGIYRSEMSSETLSETLIEVYDTFELGRNAPF